MSQNNTDVVSGINESLDISLPESIAPDELRNKLSGHINYLINHDFEKLVYYLYRIDVDENKIRKLLAAKEGENAALLITDLIIERQLQKIESRKKTGGAENIADDEKW